MSEEKLLDAFGQIEEEFIEDAAPENKPSKKKVIKSTWVKWGAMAASVLVIIGISAPHIFNLNEDAACEQLESEEKVTSNEGTQNEAGEGEINLVTLTHMEEIKIKIDEMFPDGFRGTIEVGTNLFKEGEQITIVAQDNVTVVQQDGSIFDYDELEPNIKDSDLAVGNSVWVGFQKYDYAEGNGKYNQIFAYHVEDGETRENNGANYGEGEVPEPAKAVTINEIAEPLALMLPMLSEDNRTAMTSEELYDYYGVNISSTLGRIGDFEEREGSYPKGLYGYADGSIFDLNQFVFYESKSDYTLSVSIGKKTKCSMLIGNQDADAKSSEINGIDMQIYKLKDGAEKEYYATFAFGDCDFIISGQNLDEDVFIKVLGSITK